MISQQQTPTIIQSPNGWVFFLSSDFLQVAKSNIGYTYQNSDLRSRSLRDRLQLIWLALDGVSQPYEDTDTLLMSDEEVNELPLEKQPFYCGFRILRLDTTEKALQDALYHPYKIQHQLFELEKSQTHFKISQLNHLLSIPNGKEPKGVGYLASTTSKRS